ncbi:DoxX family membrane protein [Bacillus suaedaesalsae]|uniref:DoxX family membrane protein n=1 Tax=Bacillus suaedaesalsae TaxID=2810349 RepID=A0ABS2DG66_9BACI|nr:DoxX family membrane protein [Bacillus suaedaesalsae]MBM6617444.1 DoxX family membrane protein [Bacillus suaedaesalsae]
MIKLNRILLLLFLLLISSPLIIGAHVKWFTEVAAEKALIEDILSPFFIALSLLIALLLAILTQLLPYLDKVQSLKKIDHTLDHYRKSSRYILKYGTALALVIQIFSGSLFAPEFTIPNQAVVLIMWAITILLFIPHHLATKAGAITLLCLFIYQLSISGTFHMLDYGFYLAIIAVLLLERTDLEEWGFPFLYLGTGLSLCWVAAEKWVYPAMSINIIENHGVPTFGFPPETFVVLAAFIEFVVGYLLIVGILNRLLAFVLTLIFISTTMLFGYTEIVGHFIIHIILVIFIIEGVSFYQPPIRIHKTKVDQIIFVFLNFIFVLSTFVLIYYRFA